MTEFMRSTDAFTWAMESDPRLRSTVVTVLLLEKSPDWDDVRDRIDLVTRKLPMFRQCVVDSPARRRHGGKTTRTSISTSTFDGWLRLTRATSPGYSRWRGSPEWRTSTGPAHCGR